MMLSDAVKLAKMLESREIVVLLIDMQSLVSTYTQNVRGRGSISAKSQSLHAHQLLDMIEKNEEKIAVWKEAQGRIEAEKGSTQK